MEHVITSNQDYQLVVQVEVLPKNETMVSIRRYIHNYGWAKMELYLIDDEYEKFIAAITEYSSSNPRTQR